MSDQKKGNPFDVDIAASAVTELRAELSTLLAAAASEAATASCFAEGLAAVDFGAFEPCVAEGTAASQVGGELVATSLAASLNFSEMIAVAEGPGEWPGWDPDLALSAVGSISYLDHLMRTTIERPPSTVVKNPRGRPVKISADRKEEALAVKGAGGSNRDAAKKLYGTDYPDPQQVKNASTILREHRKKKAGASAGRLVPTE
jgi:hypothetical protein